MKIILLVLDSFGIGDAEDASLYGDEGSNTYRSISENINIENLIKLGLNNIDGVKGNKVLNPLASYGRLIELSTGKDTITGHFEIAGIISEVGYPVFPNGFPNECVKELEDSLGVQFLGNIVASGTEIIKLLGDEHYKTRKPILYTSADSVLQLAISNDLYSLNEIYSMCEKARKIMVNTNTHNWGVGRIIARPFKKANGEYIRTQDRKDYSLKPIGETLLEKLSKKGINVIAIGKIYDIFSGVGVSKHIEAHDNYNVFYKALSELKINKNDSLIFANLVDFDMLYGHRNDVEGYKKAIEDFDKYLPDMLDALTCEDILIITADHGCDPSTLSTDHSRENVPLLIYQKGAEAKNLNSIRGFNFISNYILEKFKI